MGKRRRARELALTILYQREFRPEKHEEVLDLFWADHRGPPLEVGTYARELVEGTLTHREEIDTLITQYTEHWHFHPIHGALALFADRAGRAQHPPVGNL